ncbi:cytochrome P450 [Glutamicibacter sp. V16R2B1]|uniref:cytochrome P450 n=1 Tax=Glutamicibacter sp. V16R2B1 TaxID=2036207 RepID=UPI0020183BA3|nr:cytochrome P450 [Glutamicibacter sp. V16R2B1]
MPEEDQEEFLDRLQRQPQAESGVGGTGEETLHHSPLEFLYGRFTTYIEDRRRSPRADVLTQLAAATFPDGSTPAVIDVVRVAANLLAAGQETTVRLLSSALKILVEDPDLQRAAARANPTASPTSSRRPCGWRARSRATSGSPGSPSPWAAWTSPPAPR